MMTQQQKDDLVKDVAKGGSFFGVMAIALWFVWNGLEKQMDLKDAVYQNQLKEQSQRMELYYKETRECSEAYRTMLENQIEKNTEALNQTNKLLNKYD